MIVDEDQGDPDVRQRGDGVRRRFDAQTGLEGFQRSQSSGNDLSAASVSPSRLLVRGARSGSARAPSKLARTRSSQRSTMRRVTFAGIPTSTAGSDSRADRHRDLAHAGFDIDEVVEPPHELGFEPTLS